MHVYYGSTILENLALVITLVHIVKMMSGTIYACFLLPSLCNLVECFIMW